MKRTINYTGRTRLPLSQVSIRLADNGDEFFATVDLKDFSFPEDARVIAEAYERTAYERFDLGTVGGHRHTGPLPLSRVRADATLFRIKIVDESGEGVGRLLAAANKVRPATGEGESPGYVYEREPLIHAKPAALDGAIWRLDLEEEWPILEYEQDLRVDGIESYLKIDPVFRSLVYPQIMRQVLTRLLVADEDRDFDPNSWQEGWVQLASALEGNEPPDDRDNVVSWIERAVAAFSREMSAVDNMRAALAGSDA